jgi:uncharacterized protein YcaQ
MISLKTLPSFYALTPNYGSYESDYLEQYEAGLLSQESKAIYEALLHEGPLDTIALRRASHLDAEGSDYRFTRALDALQVEFKVLPVGVAPVGAWKYAFIYEIVPRHMPELENQARLISEAAARQELAMLYYEALGASPVEDLARLFGWKQDSARQAVECLLAEGWLIPADPLTGEKYVCLAFPNLLE